MPRVVPFEEKEAWFEAHQRGDTISGLARAHKKDPRTIQGGIEEVGQRRIGIDVRSGLLRDALRKHQEDMLELVDRISALMRTTFPYLKLPVRYVLFPLE